MHWRISTTVIACLLTVSCAGFRGGLESVAYIGDAPPANLAQSLATEVPRNPPRLRVSGLELRVSIDNRLRTYDTQVYLYALPLSVDPRGVYSRNVEPGKTRVFVNVTARVPGYTFNPSAATLRFAGKEFIGIAGFEFGQWDALGDRAERTGNWEHRPIASGLPLTELGRRYLLSIDFATPTPSPRLLDIELDLSRALRSPDQPSLPLIRFTPIEWEEGYT